MAIQEVNSNSLIDQTFFSNLVKAVNDNTDKLAIANSSIYSDSDKQQITSSIGNFAIATNFYTGTVKLSADNTISSQTKNISFGKTFASAPLVFVSVQLPATAARSAYIPVGIPSDVKDSNCNITVNIFSNITRTSSNTVDAFEYNVSIMAIGLIT